ncbi:hypothetical protein B4U80_04178 [Leptotrombidium deliense]|uniref:Peptidase S1 domain-containing protein n=1 Tax=Leptotrombidium deliense TaxID=299467 RepID=A0A443RVM2_9ACAR|nr:hypothetical protein B4U80_04178 [Leptotrombidium deliense]
MESSYIEYDLNKCKHNYKISREPVTITENQFCAGLNGHGTCLGDSGSPLTSRQEARHYLVGLDSFGLYCNVLNSTLYTNVFNYLDWIMENTRDGNYCTQ